MSWSSILSDRCGSACSATAQWARRRCWPCSTARPPAGRVPGLRLAAADAATAEYLGSRISQLEAGEPPAGTLAETDLQLRLYHDQARLPLILKDYQGEHIGLDSDAPIADFFADCDAVFLCLDPEGSTTPADRLRRQQEVEALIERYLEVSDDRTAGRPVALLITKYDQVLEAGGPPADHAEQLADTLYGMTRHALAQHVPRCAIFGVSSYGMGSRDGKPPSELHPMGLDAPLTWVADQLEAIDREELEWIWDLAPRDHPRCRRCVAAFAARYPRSTRFDFYQQELRKLSGAGSGSARLTSAAIAAACLTGGLAAYDAWGYRAAAAFQRVSPSPLAVEKRWSDFLAWHPTHPFFFPQQARQARASQRNSLVAAAAARVEAGETERDESIWQNLDQARRDDPRSRTRSRRSKRRGRRSSTTTAGVSSRPTTSPPKKGPRPTRPPPTASSSSSIPTPRIRRWPASESTNSTPSSSHGISPNGKKSTPSSASWSYPSPTWKASWHEPSCFSTSTPRASGKPRSRTSCAPRH